MRNAEFDFLKKQSIIPRYHVKATYRRTCQPQKANQATQACTPLQQLAGAQKQCKEGMAKMPYKQGKTLATQKLGVWSPGFYQ